MLSSVKTKIMCSIGPASIAPNILKEMYRQGMSGARINTAYNDVEYFERIIKNVRQVTEIPIIVDIKGPNIRLNAPGRIAIQKGDTLRIGFKDEELHFNFNFYDDVQVGDKVLIDNGRVETQIIQQNDNILTLRVMNGGIIDNRKGVNLPNKRLALPHLSGRDIRSIQFAIDNECEYLALSFTRSPDDIKNVRQVAKDFQGAIIAKIENFEGVENFEDILQAADAIMVARGDLGVEIEPERVPLIQKWMIERCNNAGKTVITATDILESMIENTMPTRSEASDVANAILDGTDCIMTSGETAIGKHPIETVAMITRIAREVERAVESQVITTSFINISETVSHSIQRIANNMPLDKIVTLTRSGYTARMISRLKPKQDIIAVTPTKVVRNQLEIVYGVHPIYQDYLHEKERILSVAKHLYTKGLIKDEETVLFTAASRTMEEHYSNIIEIHKMEELLKFIL